jgi:cyclophilin family peptidyl-prolyl cis-trans isomerase
MSVNISHSSWPALLLIAAIQLWVTVQAADLPRVALQTTMGTLEIELYQDQAPRTVRNFLDYVDNRFYDGMIFHRVIDDWVIQAGGYDKDLVAYETNAPIRNEATNRLENIRGTVAMAHGNDPHSADSQFFINLDDNHALDHQARTLSGYGYCVFGRVVKGMDVADAIGDVATHSIDGLDDVPATPIIINRAIHLNGVGPL